MIRRKTTYTGGYWECYNIHVRGKERERGNRMTKRVNKSLNLAEQKRTILNDIADYLTAHGYDCTDKNDSVEGGTLCAFCEDYVVDVHIGATVLVTVSKMDFENISVSKRFKIDLMAIKTVESVKRFVSKANKFIIKNERM